MVLSCSVPHCGDQTPTLKIYGPIPRRRDSRAISQQRRQYFPKLNGHILVSGGFHTQKFCFYFQQFLMERSREETFSKVDSLGIEDLPSQVRLMIHPGGILLLPAAFGARWWFLFLWIALTTVNLPNFAWNQFMFPTSTSSWGYGLSEFIASCARPILLLYWVCLVPASYHWFSLFFLDILQTRPDVALTWDIQFFPNLLLTKALGI